MDRWYEVSAFRVGGPESRKVAILFNDITDRRRAEEALRESERRERERAEELAALLDAVPTPVIIVHDPDSLHMTGNRATDELLRNPPGGEASLSAPAEVKPRHFRAFKDGRELRLDELPAQRAARGKHVRDFEFDLVFNDSTARHLLAHGTPLKDAQGRPRGAAHVLVDITERKRSEEALEQAKAAAEAASVAKNQFLASMSRDLRTPMNAVLGMTDLALAEELSPTVRDYIDTARESAGALLELLNDILDLSRTEAGRLRLESAPFRLRSLLDKTVKSLGIRACEKGLELFYDVLDDVPDHLLGDSLRVRQVLTNLAGNGAETLDLIQRRDFDLVLMDVQMPLMDGLEATAAIRRLDDAKKARLPIIAMTAHAYKSDQERCMAAGMDAYISKPVNRRELIEMVERLAGDESG